MRLGTRQSPFPPQQRKHPPHPRQSALPVGAAIVFAVLLAACGGGSSGRGSAPPQFGGISSDEPRATLAAREILQLRGAAADAAVALYFTLAVTMPSTAGLGGGGACLVYEPRFNRVEAFDFATRPVASGRTAAPTVARGMFAIQAKYGRLRWEQLLSPAETLARFGAPVSRALATDLAAAAPRLAEDPEARRLFVRADGAMLAEGDNLVQTDLAVLIAGLRARGAGEMHVGPLARRIAQGSAEIGSAMTQAELEHALPTTRPTVVVRHEGFNLHFSPPPAIGGLSAAQLWAMIAGRWNRTDADERPQLLAAATLRAAADRPRWANADLSRVANLAELVSERRAAELMTGYRADARAAPAQFNPPPIPAKEFAPGASFVVADRQGQTVACAVSLNGRFGLGRMVPGTGIFLAAPPEDGERGYQSLGAMIVIGRRGGGLFTPLETAGQMMMAAAGTGGAATASALAGVALRSIVDRRPLEEAISAPRVDYASGADAVDVEAGAEALSRSLAARGYPIQSVPALGRVNAISCPDGINNDIESCQTRSDRRGFGLAVGGK